MLGFSAERTGQGHRGGTCAFVTGGSGDGALSVSSGEGCGRAGGGCVGFLQIQPTRSRTRLLPAGEGGRAGVTTNVGEPGTATAWTPAKASPSGG